MTNSICQTTDAAQISSNGGQGAHAVKTHEPGVNALRNHETAFTSLNQAMAFVISHRYWYKQVLKLNETKQFI